jgi:hypothetical protein
MKMSRYCILYCLALTTLCSCNSNVKWQRESEKIIQSISALQYHHQLLDQRVDSLWDETTRQLALHLPQNFPAVDRAIFLKARNADHIRMFKSYELLDQDTKDLIDRAGKMDETIAVEMHQLLDQQLELEHTRNEFLRQVADTDVESSQQYEDQFRIAKNMIH